MAHAFDAHFFMISAVLGGVKEIRETVQAAQALKREDPNKRSLIFVDEVHRFNKSQQDAFLPHVESGLLTFIGATTENPSFEVNSALLSRAQVYVLQSLNSDELTLLWHRAKAIVTLPELTREAMERLVHYADGDARRLLNTVEMIHVVASKQATATTPGWVHDLEWLERVLGEQMRRHDKGGEMFYDTISALHKSVRGSDPDAALYWLMRMLGAGVEPLYVARRLIRMASEDVGLADPRALTMALDATKTLERLGSPEGELTLAQCVIYLALAPKSNAVYKAFKSAKAWVEKDRTREVPLHLRNAPTQLMKNLDYGRDYRYAHDEPDAFVAGEHYFPMDLKPMVFYEPVERGLEIKIGEKLKSLRALNEQAQQQKSRKP